MTTPNDHDDVIQTNAPADRPWPPPQTETNAEAIALLNQAAGALHMGRPARMDVWRNPLQTPQRVTFDVGEVRRPGPHGHDRLVRKTVTVTWAPGETIRLDTIWRPAIHQYHKDPPHPVIGGGAPLLVREGQSQEVHPSISADAIQEARDHENSHRTRSGAVLPPRDPRNV